ncbi:3-hydroxyacyl-ACP dehydratase FabZ family protein [Paenibacillus sp. GbtcB18]|uniref:3-hydroxyacyl-ACP dehydratase FabZ family protein n=1 Tax=Paenibacillus sp. GbtcB18 TaxID=2824763 RepID=UPI001C310E66|nr:FabA-like domain protein [Paenibacillus sp. GbtcB18]
MPAEAYLHETKPWTMVDRIIGESDRAISTLKNISSSDFYLIGHFPSYSVYPGMLMVECILQSAELLLRRQSSGKPGDCRFGEIASRFLSPVVPGDSVRFDVGFTAGGSELAAVGKVGGRTVIHCKMKLLREEGEKDERR